MKYAIGQKVDIRTAYGDKLVELAERYPITVIDADLGESLKTKGFKDRFSERYFNVGISEAHMQGKAAGLASEGFIPFTNTFAIFISRSLEQIRQSIAYPAYNVKIVGSHGGIGTGKDGASHQAIEDIGAVRPIPNMVIVSPSDALMTEKIMDKIVEYHGPVYLRLFREPTPVLHNESLNFEIGKGYQLKDGNDLTIVSFGATLHKAVEAADLLEKEKIHARVIDMPSIKPMDEEILVKAAEETGGIMTVEDHNYMGGFGSGVCEVLSEKRPTRICRIGVRDTFSESGSGEELYEKYGLGGKEIFKAAKQFVDV